MSLPAELQDAVIREAAELLRAQAGLTEAVLSELVLVRDRIVTLLSINDPTVNARALARLVNRVNEAIEDGLSRIAGGMYAALYDISDMHVLLGARSVNAVVGANLMYEVPATVVEGLVASQLIEGAPSAEWWGRQSLILQSRFVDEMRSGIANGETLGELIRRVRGRRENGFKDGIMQATTSRASAIVHTAVQSAANGARLETYARNADVIKALKWVSVLDNRTTPICRALDGKTWTLDLKPIGHDKRWPGPTAHWNCRSVQVPVLKSYEELTDGAVKAKVPPGTRASMNGQVPADTTYDEWLRKQPEELQVDVLGKSRFRLWKSGKLSLEDMTDQRNNTLTLDALRKRYGLST